MHGVLLTNTNCLLGFHRWRKSRCSLMERRVSVAFVLQPFIHNPTAHTASPKILLLHHLPTLFINLLLKFSFIWILVQVAHVFIHAHRLTGWVDSRWWIDRDLHLSRTYFTIQGVNIFYVNVVLLLSCWPTAQLHLLKLMLIPISFQRLIQINISLLQGADSLPPSNESIHFVLVVNVLSIASIVALCVIKN